MAEWSGFGARTDDLRIQALKLGPVMEKQPLLQEALKLSKSGATRGAREFGIHAMGVLNSKCIVFLIDRSWQPILGPAIKAVDDIFEKHLATWDQVGLYSLGEGWLFHPQKKYGNEAKIKAAIARANQCQGRPHLNPSLLACCEELEKIPDYISKWLIVLSDTVDLEYEQVVYEAPAGDIKEGVPPKKRALGGREMPPEMAALLKSAGAKTGAVTLSLMWDNSNGRSDLDLHRTRRQTLRCKIPDLSTACPCNIPPSKNRAPLARSARS